MSSFVRDKGNGCNTDSGKCYDSGYTRDGIDELGKRGTERFHYLMAVWRGGVGSTIRCGVWGRCEGVRGGKDDRPRSCRCCHGCRMHGAQS